jgi:RimJ/RimL family protein N-acetyltransferase
MPRPIHSGARYSRRLVIRPFRRRDVGSLHDAVESSLADLQPWLPWAGGYDRNTAQRFVRDSITAWGDGKAYDFTIRLVEDEDRHAGNVSVWWVSQQNLVGEVGYWIRSDLAGQGFGTEATARAVQVGFEEMGLHKVVLRIAVGNRGSERIAEKLGFALEGTLRAEVRVGSTWLDHTSWSLLKSEWGLTRERLHMEGQL